VFHCIEMIQGLIGELGDKPVLVSGRSQSLSVASSYGFKKSVSPEQIAAAHGGTAVPFSAVSDPSAVEQKLGVPCPVKVSADLLCLRHRVSPAEMCMCACAINRGL
jgi:hypothetical protein